MRKLKKQLWLHNGVGLWKHFSFMKLAAYFPALWFIRAAVIRGNISWAETFMGWWKERDLQFHASLPLLLRSLSQTRKPESHQVINKNLHSVRLLLSAKETVYKCTQKLPLITLCCCGQYYFLCQHPGAALVATTAGTPVRQINPSIQLPTLHQKSDSDF